VVQLAGFSISLDWLALGYRKTQCCHASRQRISDFSGYPVQADPPAISATSGRFQPNRRAKELQRRGVWWKGVKD
jgi:hypothetical protein